MDTNDPRLVLRPTQANLEKLMLKAHWASLHDFSGEYRVVLTATKKLAVRKAPQDCEGGVYGDTTLFAASHSCVVGNCSMAQKAFKDALPEVVAVILATNDVCDLIPIRREPEATGPASNLQARRLAAGLSQSQLAQKAGIKVRTLQQYEQRTMNINHAAFDKIDRLCKVLRCKPRDIFNH